MLNNWKLDWWLPGQGQRPLDPYAVNAGVYNTILSISSDVLIMSPAEVNTARIAADLVRDYASHGYRVTAVFPDELLMRKFNYRIDSHNGLITSVCDQEQLSQSPDSDITIIDEAESFTDDLLRSICYRRSRKILFFVPFECDPHNPPLIRSWWDHPNEVLKIRLNSDEDIRNCHIKPVDWPLLPREVLRKRAEQINHV